MAILLELQYGKKIGLPEYSSHNFSVSMKAEVSDISQVQQKVEEAYQALQQAVDGQIVHPGYIPGHTQGAAASARPDGGWNCSDKQRDLILKVMDENNLNPEAVDELAVERFGHPVQSLNKLQASGLIDELFHQTRRKQPIPLRRAA